MNRNVWMLFMCQALNGAAGISQALMSALIGYALATDKSWATVPYALQMAGTMAASIPAGIIFSKLGRRAGFLAGTFSTLLGIAILFYALLTSNFALFCVGSLPMGIGFGIGQHYRFAASEVADQTARAKAIALVMAGGVISALLGPEMVKHTKSLLDPVLFLGTYAITALLPLVSSVLLVIVDLPPAPPPQRVPTPIGTILARPAFITSAGAGMVGYGAMNLVMTTTPLQMMACGFGVDASADVIRAHAFFMFAPGFFTGPLIQRFGVHRIIVAGGVLNIMCALLAFGDPSFWNFFVALSLLGLGWNFMFVGATTLLATAHAPAERVKAQAANDLIVFGTVTVTALTSGALQTLGGWAVVNSAIIPPVIIACALVLWHRIKVARLNAGIPSPLTS